MSESLELDFNERNKRIGILIAFMAGALAISEMAGDNAADDMLRDTIQASDTWAFFQAKTIRMTTLRAQADGLEAASMEMKAGPASEAIKKTVAAWRATADRYESEPDTGEGRKELMARARAIEQARNDNAAADTTFDLASGALQLGILLASAAVVTSLLWLAYIGAGFGAAGVVLGVLGAVAPQVFG